MTPKPAGPVWKPPAPYGAPDSVQATGTVAAPLLAGFTITLIGLVVDTSNQGIRHRDTALLALMAAAASLLAAIQCAYSARRYMVVPDELTSWWPDAKDHPETQLRRRQEEQFAHRLLHTQWATRFRVVYHVGIILMLAGLTVLLIPPEAARPVTGQTVPQADVSTVRWLAIGLAGASAVGEVIWIAATRLNDLDATGRVGRLVAVIARRLVPSYRARSLDARASMGATRLRTAIRDLKLHKDVTASLDWHLGRAALSFERGRREDGKRALYLFKLLATFQACFNSSGLSSEGATKLIKGADLIVAGLPKPRTRA